MDNEYRDAQMHYQDEEDDHDDSRRDAQDGPSYE